MSVGEARDLLLMGLEVRPAASIVDHLISLTWRWPLVLRLLNEVLVTREKAGYSTVDAVQEIANHLSVRGPTGADELDVEVGPRTPSDLVEPTTASDTGWP
jgi:hypothetical protein